MQDSPSVSVSDLMDIQSSPGKRYVHIYCPQTPDFMLSICYGKSGN